MYFLKMFKIIICIVINSFYLFEQVLYFRIPDREIATFHKNYGVTDILENRIDIKSYKCVKDDGNILPTYNCVPARRR